MKIWWLLLALLPLLTAGCTSSKVTPEELPPAVAKQVTYNGMSAYEWAQQAPILWLEAMPVEERMDLGSFLSAKQFASLDEERQELLKLRGDYLPLAERYYDDISPEMAAIMDASEEPVFFVDERQVSAFEYYTFVSDSMTDEELQHHLPTDPEKLAASFSYLKFTESELEQLPERIRVLYETYSEYADR